MIKRYKVKAEKVHLPGAEHKKGETFSAESTSAHIQTALHFQQIEETAEKPAKPAPEEKPDSKADPNPDPKAGK